RFPSSLDVLTFPLTSGMLERLSCLTILGQHRLAGESHDDDGHRGHDQRTANQIKAATEVPAGLIGRTNHVRSREAAQRAKGVDESDGRGSRSTGKESRWQTPKRRFRSAHPECGQ